MRKIPLNSIDRLQWILEFNFHPKNNHKNLFYRVFLINIDKEKPSNAEFIWLKKDRAIVAEVFVSEKTENVLKLDFKNSKFRKYSDSEIKNFSIVRRTIKKIEFESCIEDDEIGSGKLPQCKLITKRNKVKLGRAIPIPYDIGISNKSMPTNEISWDDFFDLHQKHECRPNILFRGQADSSWGLIPSYYRLRDNSLNTRLLRHLDEIENCDELESDNLISKLIEAQHMNYPTALLDWTESPFVAAFFAFSENRKFKRKTNYVRVFSAKTDGFYFDNLKLFDDKAVTFFKAKNIKSNIAKFKADAQKSHFSYSVLRSLSKKFPEPNMLKEYWDIPTSEKEKALKCLNEIKINRESLGLNQ